MSEIIEVGEATPSDYDSAYHSDGSETQSLTSSITSYIYENGRRYHSHSDGKYVAPNDETEQSRLDLNHHLQLILLGGSLCTAPIGSSPSRVLDAGTGTGIWALDFGDTFPDSTVYGVDLSPIQPSWVASNVKFEVDDLTKPWTYQENFFDFVHSRHMALGMRDWENYIREMYTATKEGGLVELSEQEQNIHSDDRTVEGTNLKKWFEVFLDCAGKAGLQLPDPEELVKTLEEAGFIDVKVKTFKQPWGMWPKDKKLKEIGKLVAGVAENGFAAHGLALMTRFGGMEIDVANNLCKDAFKDILSGKVHAYNRLWHVVGRKPVKSK